MSLYQEWSSFWTAVFYFIRYRMKVGKGCEKLGILFLPKIVPQDLPCSLWHRRIQEKMKGCEVESKRESVKERNRRRETKAIWMPETVWGRTTSPRRGVSLEDISHKGKPSTLVPHASLLPGRTLDMCKFPSRLHGGRHGLKSRYGTNIF